MLNKTAIPVQLLEEWKKNFNLQREELPIVESDSQQKEDSADLYEKILKKLDRISEQFGFISNGVVSAVDKSRIRKEFISNITDVIKSVNDLKSKQKKGITKRDLETAIEWAKRSALYCAQNERKLELNAEKNLIDKLASMKKQFN